VKATLSARTIDRLTELMEDLILADDHRIAADRNRDRMTDRGLADEEATAGRKPLGGRSVVIG
jgi:hypothetical protein